MLRKMNIEDLKEVQELDNICFGDINYRRLELFKSFLDVDDCSLVYEEEGRIVGYIFNHIFGEFAWFGTFGIHADFRGKSIGKDLLKATIEMFYNEFKVKNIGLITMPHSGYNIGFYIKNGFIPKEMSLRCSKMIESKDLSLSSKDIFNVELVDIEKDSNYNNMVNIAKEISDSLYEGLDMSPELQLLRNNKLGTSFLVYEENQIIGFGIIRNKTIFEEEGNTAHIRLLCLKATTSNYNEAVEAVLITAYKYCADNELMEITIDVNTINHEICSFLLCNHNFRVEKTSVTLIMGDENFYSSINGIMCFKAVT